MQIDGLVKGGIIELEVKYNGRTITFRSTIEFIIENSVLIKPITVNEQTVGFSEKCTINFVYILDGKIYLWENTIVKYVKYEGLLFHKIELTGSGKPFNRRNYYRIYIGEDMPLYINTANGPTAISVLVKDLSESGVAFITKEEFDLERTIRLKLKDNSAIINLSGVIVRKEFLTNLNSYLYGCKFNDKNIKLGKYIAKRQGEQLKKSNSYSSPQTKNINNTKNINSPKNISNSSNIQNMKQNNMKNK